VLPAVVGEDVDLHLLEQVVHAIAGLNGGRAEKPATEADRLRDYAVYARQLCDIAHYLHGDQVLPALDALAARFRVSFYIEPERIPELLGAALAKLREFSGVLGFNTAESAFCQGAESLVADQPRAAGAAATAEEMIQGTVAPAIAPAANKAQRRPSGWLGFLRPWKRITPVE